MSDAIRDFRDLIVWRKVVTFAKEVYKLTRRLPADEQFGLTAQIRRAAVSVSSNIAEGHSRQGKEFGRFLSIARGSVAEVQSQLELCRELGFVDAAAIEPIESSATEIRWMCAALARKIAARQAGED